jgi:hypothetical protein
MAEMMIMALCACMRPGRVRQKKKNGTNEACDCNAPFVPFFFFISLTNRVA